MNLILIDLFYGAYGKTFSKQEVEFVQNRVDDSYLIFYMLGEQWEPELANRLLLRFFNDYTNKPNIMFIGDSLNTNEELAQIVVPKKCKLNSQLLKVAQYEEAYGFNTEINLDTNRFLFLMGKPYKSNRLPLLYKLHKRDLLKFCDYSFYYDKNYENRTKEVMHFLKDSEYNDFVNTKQRTLDTITYDIGYNYFNYIGLPVDKNLYKNTSFSIVAETEDIFKNYEFLSEKTWRTIANKHMFVIPTHKNSKNYLNSLGIRTFDYCLKHSKEKFNTHEWDELNTLTVDDVEHVLKNINIYEYAIKDDIEHNYSVYRTLVEKSRQKINKFIEDRLYITEIVDIPYLHLQVLELVQEQENVIVELLERL